MNRKRARLRIPPASLRRLCAVYGHLEQLLSEGQSRVTSQALAENLGTSAASIRRDIHRLGGLGPSPVGYDVSQLKRLIEERTGLGRPVRVCVVGLDWLGQALVGAADKGLGGGFRIVAGFDANINRLETITSSVPLYPTYEIEAVVRREAVELAVLTVGGRELQRLLQLLARAGVRGVLNLTGRPLGPDVPGLVQNSVAVTDELRYLCMILHLEEGRNT